MGRGWTWMALAIGMAAPVRGQAPDEAQTSRMMLEEIRQLRHDLETLSVAVERTQIVLFRLQVSEMAVNRAANRVEQARDGLRNAQQFKQGVEEQIKNWQTQPPPARMDAAQYAGALSDLKQQLERARASEQMAQADLVETEGQLRAETARRDELLGKIDQIDRMLVALTRPAGQ